MAVDKIHLVHSTSLPIPIQEICFMAPFSLSENCFEYYSTCFFFHVIARTEFPWHYFCGAALQGDSI